MSDLLTHIVTPAQAGQRLDQALAALRPDLGLRGRRRLCAVGLALLNGHPVDPAHKVRPGDVLLVKTQQETVRNPEIRLISRTDDLAAVYKPAGLSSAQLAGGVADSLEHYLPELLDQANAQLLNRLDHGTSGLLAVALNAHGAQAWQTAQQHGAISKIYLALLDGELTEQTIARQALDMGKRSMGKALPTVNPDPARHSVFQPLAGYRLDGESRNVTLAVVEIRKGARHQIRAHATWLGLPVLGDQAFGSAYADSYGFFLHHAHLGLDKFRATVAPPWLARLPQAVAKAAQEFLDALL